MWHADLQLWHIESSSLTRGSNLGPLHWECEVLATGPPGRLLGGLILGLFYTTRPSLMQKSHSFTPPQEGTIPSTGRTKLGHQSRLKSQSAYRLQFQQPTPLSSKCKRNSNTECYENPGTEGTLCHLSQALMSGF